MRIITIAVIINCIRIWVLRTRHTERLSLTSLNPVEFYERLQEMLMFVYRPK
jgi:hypothetical protein